MGDQAALINMDEASITAAFQSALKSRQTLELNSGIAMNLYCFEKQGSDWCKGELFPITKSPSPIDKKGNRISVWICDAADEQKMRDLVTDLFDLDDRILLKPTFAAYNKKVQKTVVCCLPFSDQFSNWIAKHGQVPLDGYLRKDAKKMIRSMLPFMEALWAKGYVCDGLNDPQNYAMMDSDVRVLPFTIRRKQDSDNDMYHRHQFADLLENHLNTIWKDVDVEEFIECLRDPNLSLDNLMNHPLLIPPESRMALYINMWRDEISVEQQNKYSAITLYDSWVNSVPTDDEQLQGILTYNMKNIENKVPMYQSNTRDAHRFARNTCSHYLKMWRNFIPPNGRPKCTNDIVDKPLKRLFPRLLSKIYAFSCQCDWAA